MFKRRLTSLSANDISLIFIGLMFFLPFINMHHARPLTVFYSEWIAALMGLLSVASLLLSNSWHKPTYQLVIPRSSIILVGLSIIICMQWAMGMLHSSRYALLALSYLVLAFLMVVLGGYLRNELGMQKLAIVLAFSIVVAGVVNILIVVLQLVALTGGAISFIPSLSSFGALAQSNHFANYISLAISSLIYLHSRGNFSKSFYYFVLVLFIFLLSFSGSRSAWLYLISISALAYIYYYLNKSEAKYASSNEVLKKVTLILLPIFAFVQIFIYLVIPNDFVNLPTERLFDGVTATSTSLRLQFWQDSIHIFLQSPWLGVGTGKFMANTFLILDSPSAASKIVFEHAHNLFLHLLAEMGPISILIVLFGLAAWIKAFKWRKLNLETWWLICLLSIISIHSILEYPLWFAFFLGIFSLLIGVGDENNISIRLNIISHKNIYRGLTVLLMLGFLNLGTLLIANIKLENWIQKFSYEGISDNAELNWVKKYSLLSPSGQQMDALTMNIDSRLINENLLVTQAVMNFKPNAIVAYKHALLLRLNGKNNEAILQFKRARIVYPKQFGIVLENTSEKYREEFMYLLSKTRPALVK